MPAEHNGSPRRRVVILGGGFGGLAAAQKLRRADVEVTLVDRTNHHLFQPLLYQLAAGAIAAGECAAPLRAALRRSANTTVVMAEATDVDAERRQVILDGGERLDYDSLIVACGARTSYFGHDEWQHVSCGLKTLGDALDLRNRVYAAFEQAERARDREARDGWLTFAVVGGGATGVEVAGALAILADHMPKRSFARIDPTSARVVLLDAGERVVPAFSEKLSAKAARYLAELGVTVREGARATEIDPHGVTIAVGGATERIPARTVIWAAGVRAASMSEIARAGHRSEHGSGGTHRGAARPDAARASRDLGDRRHDEPGGARRQAVAGARDGRHPAGASRREGDPQRSAGGLHAVSLLRQGRARSRRSWQGGLRGQGGRALRPPGVRHLPGRPPLLPRRRRRPALGAAHRLGLRANRPPAPPGDRGRARGRRAGGRRGGDGEADRGRGVNARRRARDQAARLAEAGEPRRPATVRDLSRPRCGRWRRRPAGRRSRARSGRRRPPRTKRAHGRSCRSAPR